MPSVVVWLRDLARFERVCYPGVPGDTSGTGGHVTDVQVEQANLDTGIPVMYRDFGQHVRVAYDPSQISEAAALALLCVRMPRLIGSLDLIRH